MGLGQYCLSLRVLRGSPYIQLLHGGAIIVQRLIAYCEQLLSAHVLCVYAQINFSFQFHFFKIIFWGKG